MHSDLLLKVENVSRTFPGVKALDKVTFELKKGEIHAIIGENGAGKSTLTKIICGLLQPDSDDGRILFETKKISFRMPKEAIKNGICYVAQELNDFPELSVAENIFVSKLTDKPLSFVSKKELTYKARNWLKEFEININPDVPVKKLSTSLRQIVQILKALTINPKILVLDEPTTSLDLNEAQDLFGLLKKLNKKGVTILYITHHLAELFGLVDRVTVLRDGKLIDTKGISQVRENDLAKMMVGRNIKDFYAAEAYTMVEQRVKEVIFKVKNLTNKKYFHDISFELRRGEILGFFGLIGAGRTELFKSILGVFGTDSGSIFYKGKKIRMNGMHDAVTNSIAYLPEDRKQEGLFLDLSVNENLVAPQTRAFSNKIGVLNKKKMLEFSLEIKEKFNIITSSIKKKVQYLSGGNQQKVLLGMWVGTNPEVLVVDEPTKGVDVGTKQQIYYKLRKLSEEGIGIILISSDLPEVIQLSDRIIVMCEGKINGVVEGESKTEEKIMELATGIKAAR
jgi:ABC-type sugar transport system ATPase subunit